MGTLVVFGALALRMTEKQRTAADRERHNRKDTQGEVSPKGAFPPRRLTIPAAGMPEDGAPSSCSGEVRYHNASSRRTPGASNREPGDHTLATHPVGPHRSSTPGGVPGDREPPGNA